MLHDGCPRRLIHQRLQVTLQANATSRTTVLEEALYGEAEDARLPKPSVGRLVPKQARTINGIGAPDQPYQIF